MAESGPTLAGGPRTRTVLALQGEKQMFNTTTIGALAAGNLAIITRPGNNNTGFVGYAIRVDPRGDVMSPVIFLGPKPVQGEHARPGTQHPIFVDMPNETPCVLVSADPKIWPVLDQRSTGFESIRNTFGNPQGQGKLFHVGQHIHIQVDDSHEGYYYVRIGEWRLVRAAPQGSTGICTRWEVSYIDDRGEVVVARFE